MSDAGRRRLARFLGFACLALAGYYLTLGGEYSLFDVAELEGLRDGYAVRVDSLKAHVDSLEAWADSLESDPLAIERVAREDHSFIRDGERLYLFVDVPEPVER